MLYKHSSKRYRLKRALPTFREGDEFELRPDGCLYLCKTSASWRHWKNRVMAYHRNTLELFPNILEDWFEEIDERPWKPEFDDKYWFIGSMGVGNETAWTNDAVDNCRFQLGNCFQTNEQAKKAIEWLKAFKVLRDDTKGFNPDWGNSKQDKLYVGYNTSKLYVQSVNACHEHLIYFATYADARESIEKHSHEWKIFLGVEEGQ